MAPSKRTETVATAPELDLLPSRPTEAVLRGGHLSQPVLLQGLITRGGAAYLPLWKTHPQLNMFLTRTSSCRRPLAHAAFMRDISAERDRVQDEFKRSWMEGEQDASGEDPVDKLFGGEQDASGESKPKAGRRTKKRGPPLTAIFPETFTLHLQRESGAPWTPRILADSKTKAVSMECNVDSLVALFEKAAAEAQDASSEKPRRGKAAKEPQDINGGRYYYMKTREKWIRKTYIKKTPGGRPYSTKYFTKVFKEQRRTSTFTRGDSSSFSEFEDSVGGSAFE